MERILDAHCHIYPGKIAEKATRNVGEFYRLEMHMDGTAEGLIAAGEQYGITDFLVHSVSTTPHQVSAINHFIAAQVQAYPGRLIGFGTLHPDSETLEEDVSHLLSLGLQGVKLHPDFQKFAIDSDRSVAMCRLFEGKLPLLVHAGDPRYEFSNPENLLRFMEKLPGLVVIAAHFGGWNNWKRALELLPGTPNLYVDCSSSLYAMTGAEASAAIEAFGADRVLFGSDYPMWNPGEELARLRSLGLSHREERRILWENAMTVLGRNCD
jgi:predicted TIM-barrel fold metal-dependent hydrolase